MILLLPDVILINNLKEMLQKFSRILIFVLIIFGINSCVGYNDKAENHAIIPGIRRAFKPVINFPEVAKFAGVGAELISIKAIQVESDGTMDIQARRYHPRPKIVYYFVRPFISKKTENIVIKTPDKTGTDEIVIETQEKEEIFKYQDVKVTITYTNQFYGGMSRIITGTDKKKKTISPPKCTFKQLWDIAKNEGAIENATARINYDNSGYKFFIIDKYRNENGNITDTIFYMKINLKCELIEKK